ncbi:hypothetical protein C6H64_01625 [Photorhabdus luminescens]|uniref:tail fiber assembly protein n=1 Tax=Photorhabdus TaxID=29487 RepID=UPI0009E40591|nr:tail fiber assembly protein [Photorhabdus aegyptia]PQQ32826.1 hypothetical protein C6H64_01625 [Photorhabdus luminescens]PQQ35366.1 hypothetical protein C6H69_00300 [Photorhabdus luminescens]
MKPQDKDLLKFHQINDAKQQQAALLQQANETLSLLQHSVDLDVSTATGKSSLLEWKKYWLLLIRVDVLQASDVQ